MATLAYFHPILSPSPVVSWACQSLGIPAMTRRPVQVLGRLLLEGDGWTFQTRRGKQKELGLDTVTNPG